jgi:hypothetical protein
MRILTSIALSASLMTAAPVLAGFEPMPDLYAQPQAVNETIIAKTAPDGTWPFALKDEATQPVIYYSI